VVKRADNYIPPKVWKEVYASNYSVYPIVLLKTIPATYHPAQPESWSFKKGGTSDDYK
jgi:hypothetical protein